MRTFSTAAVIFLLNFLVCLPQNWNRVDMLHQDAEYYMANFQYELAATTYIKMLEELPENENLMFMAGYSYLNAGGQDQKAFEYLKKAAGNISPEAYPGSIKEEKAPLETLLLLGVAYQRNNLFEEAKDSYEIFKDELPTDHHLQMVVDRYIESCHNAKDFMSDPGFIRKINLGKDINSIASNVNAVVSGDGQTMAYTSISRHGFDIYVARRENDNWKRPVNISHQLENDYLMTTSLSHEGNTIYFVYHGTNRSDIYSSSYDDGRWSSAERVGRPVSRRRSNETHASISGDGETLYFTSDRSGGYGGLDIYRATLNRRGRWDDVENLGPTINTPFNEETPFPTSDGKYLFFSSEGHNSMGGYDIFYAETEDLSNVHNAGYPLNNTGDNIFFFPLDNGETGYISLYGEDSYGQKDIYKVILEEDHELVAEETLMPGPDDIATDSGEVIDPEASESKVPDIAIKWNYQASGGIESETEKLSLKTDSNYLVEDTHDGVIYREGYGKSFNVQFMALAEKVNEQVFERTGGNDAIVIFDKDGFSRVISQYYHSYDDARKELTENYRETYSDAFIRINDFSPNYTIQLVATSNFINPEKFDRFPRIYCHTGNDGIYRYTWGDFGSREEAASHLPEIWEMGYSDAFIKEIDMNPAK